MSFISVSGGGTSEELQSSINKTRLENAAAFQSYVSAKKANGDKIDPTDRTDTNDRTDGIIITN